MTSWLRQNKKDSRKLTPMELIFNFMSYLHSGDKDTSKLTNMLSSNFKSSNINSKGDKYNQYDVSSYVEFFQKYYRELRTYQKFNLNDMTIKYDAGNKKYKVDIKGTMMLFDNEFNYWRLMEIYDQYYITIDTKLPQILITNIDSQIDAKFIKYVFDET